MSPDAINKAHGKPVWQCWGCKVDSGLHWWNGLSVAVCQRPECGEAYSAFLSESIQEQQDFDDYVRENAPY